MRRDPRNGCPQPHDEPPPPPTTLFYIGDDDQADAQSAHPDGNNTPEHRKTKTREPAPPADNVLQMRRVPRNDQENLPQTGRVPRNDQARPPDKVSGGGSPPCNNRRSSAEISRWRGTDCMFGDNPLDTAPRSDTTQYGAPHPTTPPTRLAREGATAQPSADDVLLQ